MTPLNILAIDTATEACSAAIKKGNETFKKWEFSPQQHSQRLLPMVEAVLAEAELDLSDIDLLAFGRGPGSFTGVRIATGMIQGLALGAEKPVVGISNLAAMAEQTSGRRISVAIDARMNEVYYAQYERAGAQLKLVDEEAVIAPELAAEKAEKFKPDAIAGTGWAAYSPMHPMRDLLSVEVEFPCAESMLDLAAIQFIKTGGQKASETQPVYLRDKVTWKKLPGRE